MPYTINGIGTWYWGKRNSHAERATCPHCSRLSDLLSYDTTLYFTVVYLPVIPLGKKRILQECSSCRKHRVLDLAKWNELKQEDLRSLTAGLKQNPDDVGTLKRVLIAFIQYQDKAGFLAAATKMRENLPRDTGLLEVLASGYEFAGDLAQAEQMLLQSYGIEPNFSTLEQTARLQILQVRPDDSAPLLQHLLDQRKPERSGLLALQMLAWQQKGQHREALDFLEKVFATYPELRKDKEFLRIQKVSTKHQRTGKIIRSPYFKGGKKASDSIFTGHLAAWIFPILLVFGVLCCLGLALFKGWHQTVQLVSGLDILYNVEIDGKPYTLRPYQIQPIDLSTGSHRVKFVNFPQPIPDQESQLKTNILTRAFSDDIFVVNPDRVAVISWIETVYSIKGGDAKFKPNWKLHTGAVFYEFGSVDYPFRDFPDEIDLPSQTAEVHKTRLELSRKLTGADYLTTVKEHAGNGTFLALMERHVELEPENSLFLQLLYLQGDPEKFKALLRKGLAEKPIRMEWHRIYQEMIRKEGKENELITEYEQMLAKSPEDGALLYLYGRLFDGEKAMEYFRKAAAAQPPCSYGFFAQAYDQLIRAHFREALDLGVKGEKIDPKNPNFASVLWYSRVGLKDWDGLLGVLGKKREKEPRSLEIAGLQVQVMLGKGETEKARELADTYLKSTRGLSAENKVASQAYLDLLFSFARGDWPDYVQNLKKMGDSFALQVALCEGKATEALEICRKTEKCPATSYLYVYLLASKSGDHTVRDAALQAAIETLATGSAEQQRMGSLLASKETVDAVVISELSFMPDDKSVYMASLGLAHPEIKEAAHRMAAQLNSDLGFPGKLLESWMTAASSSPSSPPP